MLTGISGVTEASMLGASLVEKSKLRSGIRTTTRLR